MNYWEIDDNIFNNESSAKQYIINNFYLDELFDDYLNEVYGEVEICGYTYNSASALKEIDNVAYRTGYNDWLDTLDIDLPCSYDGEDDEIYGFTVTYHCDEDDEDDIIDEFESYNRKKLFKM